MVRGGHSISRTLADYSLSDIKPKKLTILKVAGYSLGVTGSGWLLYFNVGGWKADVLWLVLAAFWFVQTLRACMKLWFEYREGQIELEEKRARYKKDIFS